MFVVFHDRQSGKVVCKAPVSESGRSATENSLVTVDGGVIVENNYGYTGPPRVMHSRASEPGIARVNVNGDEREVAGTKDVVIGGASVVDRGGQYVLVACGEVQQK